MRKGGITRLTDDHKMLPCGQSLKVIKRCKQSESPSVQKDFGNGVTDIAQILKHQ